MLHFKYNICEDHGSCFLNKTNQNKKLHKLFSKMSLIWNRCLTLIDLPL